MFYKHSPTNTCSLKRIIGIFGFVCRSNVRKLKIYITGLYFYSYTIHNKVQFIINCYPNEGSNRRKNLIAPVDLKKVFLKLLKFLHSNETALLKMTFLLNWHKIYKLLWFYSISRLLLIRSIIPSWDIICLPGLVFLAVFQSVFCYIWPIKNRQLKFGTPSLVPRI